MCTNANEAEEEHNKILCAVFRIVYLVMLPKNSRKYFITRVFQNVSEMNNRMLGLSGLSQNLQVIVSSYGTS